MKSKPTWSWVHAKCLSPTSFCLLKSNAELKPNTNQNKHPLPPQKKKPKTQKTKPNWNQWVSGCRSVKYLNAAWRGSGPVPASAPLFQWDPTHTAWIQQGCRSCQLGITRSICMKTTARSQPQLWWVLSCGYDYPCKLGSARAHFLALGPAGTAWLCLQH